MCTVNCKSIKDPRKKEQNKQFICTTILLENSEVKSFVPMIYGLLLPAESTNLHIFFSETTYYFWKFEFMNVKLL